MKKILIGTVVSNKMKDTVVVAVNRTVFHPLYGKKLRKTSRFSVDVGGLKLGIGDKVKIEEVRPISKTKQFKVIGKEEAA